MTAKKKTTRKETAVAKKEEGGGLVDLSTIDPTLAAMFDDRAGDDFENAQADDLTLPRINLVNFTSAAAKKEPDDPEYAAAGSYVSNIDGRVFASGRKSELVFVPVRYWKSRINFYDMDAAGPDGIKCQSFDFFHGQGNPGGDCRICRLKDWGADNQKPECQEVHNFVVLLPDQEEIARLGVLSFRSKSFPVGKQLMQLTMTASKGRMFTKGYRIGSRLDKVGQNEFLVPELRKWEGMNRFDLDVRKAFADLGAEGLAALVKEASEASELVKSLREQGAFKVAETFDREGEGGDTSFDVDGDDGMAWDDIAEGA